MSPARAGEEPLNNGEDPTKPLNRFDVRMEVETLPDARESGRVFDDRHSETLTLRTDLLVLPKPDQLEARVGYFY